MAAKSVLIRQFHTVLAMLDNPEAAKEAILTSFGVDSTKDLTEYQLEKTIAAIRMQWYENKGMCAEEIEMDKWRKRVIAVIGEYLHLNSRVSNINIIKGIACRQTRKVDFNKITKEQLRNCYNLFLNKNKTLKSGVNQVFTVIKKTNL